LHYVVALSYKEEEENAKQEQRFPQESFSSPSKGLLFYSCAEGAHAVKYCPSLFTWPLSTECAVHLGESTNSYRDCRDYDIIIKLLYYIFNI
jgi:hypothetical protein